MSKTFTCKELGGVCDEKFSGDTFMEVVQKGAIHMQKDEEHMQSTKNLEQKTGEDQKQWFERMQGEFEKRIEDGK